MGLFNLFKKNEPSHREKVELAYRCYKPEMVGMVFPNGKTQAETIITSLAKLYGVNLNQCDAKQYYEILTTYSDVLIRQVVTQSSHEQIINSLMIKHGSLISNEAVAHKALAFVMLNMKNNNFSLETEEDMSSLDFLTSIFSNEEQLAKSNMDAENQHLDDPEYGLVVNKPIYTNGVNGSKKYLAGLKTVSGESLEWERRGSTSASGISGMIDIYDGTLSSGKLYKTIYINMYGTSNSMKIPVGFSK